MNVPPPADSDSWGKSGDVAADGDVESEDSDDCDDDEDDDEDVFGFSFGFSYDSEEVGRKDIGELVVLSVCLLLLSNFALFGRMTRASFSIAAEPAVLLPLSPVRMERTSRE